MVWQRKKQVSCCKKTKKKVRHKLCTVVSRVITFVGNPVLRTLEPETVL